MAGRCTSESQDYTEKERLSKLCLPACSSGKPGRCLGLRKSKSIAYRSTHAGIEDIFSG